MRKLCLFAMVCAGCGGGAASGGADSADVLFVRLEALTEAPVAGQPFAVRVTAMRNGAPDATFHGTVSFATTAPGAQLPAPYTFTPADSGQRDFAGLSIGAAGAHDLRVQLSGDGVASGMLPIQIAPAPPAGPAPVVEIFLTKSGEPIRQVSVPEAVVAADFDGDGDLDLLTSPNGQSTKLMHRNDGTGVFDAGITVAWDDWINMATCDADGDGDIDIVAVRTQEHASHLWRNDGTGNFTKADQKITDSRWLVASGDLNGDGATDLLFGDAWTIEVWVNDGSGAFGMTESHEVSDLQCLALADLDGDGDLDLVSGHYGNFGAPNRVWRNDGGSLVDTGQRLLRIGSRGTTLVIKPADFDGDGDLDLLFGNYFDTNSVWRNDGDGAFTYATTAGAHCTVALAVLDLDNDGDLDIVNGTVTEVTDLWINIEGVVFREHRDPVDLNFTVALATGDMDGDGDVDLVHAAGPTDGDSGLLPTHLIRVGR